MSDQVVDLLVIGGGAAGLGAARAGLWQGASVGWVTDGPLGGDCTFGGCVPSKSLIEAARQGMDFGAALDHVGAVVAQVAAGETIEHFVDQGARVIQGRARFVAERTVEAAGSRIEGRRVIIATGARAATLPRVEDPDDDRIRVRLPDRFFERRPLPDELVIVGGGPVGVEMAEAMARFGVTVTLVESGPRVLSGVAVDAAELVRKSLVASGVHVRLGTRAVDVERRGDHVEVILDDGAVVSTDEVLVAAGRVPVTAGLNLVSAGLTVSDAGAIPVDRNLRTEAPGVYAAGDVTGICYLSSAADEMGRTAAWNALGRGNRHRFRPELVPQVIVVSPEVAVIGISEVDAPRGARVAEAAMAENDRALAAGRPEGFVRLIARPSRGSGFRLGGRIVGATIVGGGAGELINEVALVMRSRAFAGRLAQTTRSYPSWSTVLQKAAARLIYEYDGRSWREPNR